MTVDSQNRPILLIFVAGSADTGFGFVTGGQDFVLQKFTALGAPIFAIRGQPDSDEAHSVAIGPSDIIYALGSCNNTFPLANCKLQKSSGISTVNAQTLLKNTTGLNNIFWLKIQP